MEPLLENSENYVRGLPEEVTENAPSEHGRVLKANVPTDGAKAAIGDVEDHVILGTKDNEGDKCTNRESIGDDLRPSKKKIFVGGLPHGLTVDEFKSFFGSFGKTTDVVIIVNTVSRIARGFGFVTYESEESARAVLRTSRYLIHGKEVEVKVAIPKKKANTTKHPNKNPQGQHRPSAGVNPYHHDSSFRPMYGMIVGPPYANSAPIYPYVNSPAYAYGMAAPSPALAYSMAAPLPAHAYGMAAPSPAHAFGMAAPSPAHVVNGFHRYNGYTRTAGNGNGVAPRPFTKIRISKPPGINGKDSACPSSASRVKDPPPASEDSNLDGRPSPSGINDGQAKINR